MKKIYFYTTNILWIYYQYTILIYYTTKKPSQARPRTLRRWRSVSGRWFARFQWRFPTGVPRNHPFFHGNFPFSNQKYVFFMVFMGIFHSKPTKNGVHTPIKMDSHIFSQLDMARYLVNYGEVLGIFQGVCRSRELERGHPCLTDGRWEMVLWVGCSISTPRNIDDLPMKKMVILSAKTPEHLFFILVVAQVNDHWWSDFFADTS